MLSGVTGAEWEAEEVRFLRTAAALGGGTLLTGTIVFPCCPGAVRALVCVSLLATLNCAPLLGSVSFDSPINRHRAPRGAAPLPELLGLLGTRLRHELVLLAQRFVQARDEGLVVAGARSVHAAAGPFGEVAQIVRLIALQLGELGFTLAQLALGQRECLCIATLVIVEETLCGL
jgi:hypothetical protein